MGVPCRCYLHATDWNLFSAESLRGRAALGKGLAVITQPMRPHQSTTAWHRSHDAGFTQDTWTRFCVEDLGMSGAPIVQSCSDSTNIGALGRLRRVRVFASKHGGSCRLREKGRTRGSLQEPCRFPHVALFPVDVADEYCVAVALGSPCFTALL